MRAKSEARKTPAKPRETATSRAKLPVTAASAAAPAPRVPRRAVFIDVENTSSENDLLRVLDDLKIDRGTTELTAVGNWRVAGQQLGRTLAQRGAQLVHSAPVPRVPDWSDLWIAVSAGMWLGRSAPGDRLDIVSDDRAFDAVGDAAARLGVGFHRITYRTHPAAAERAAEAGEARSSGRRRRRRRSDGRGDGGGTAQALSVRQPVMAAADAVGADEEGPHAASQEQILATIARLTAGDPSRGVNLDALTVALKAEGFQRPPGSPRLVTRLRRLKNLEVLPNGRVRLIGAAAEVAVESSAPVVETAVEPGPAPEQPPGAPAPVRQARRSRRGGRRRSARRRAAQAAPPTTE